VTGGPSPIEPWRARARQALPWRLRRFLRSAAEDARSLPVRLLQPARRADPWNLVHNVGGGDFQARVAMCLGEALGAGLRPNDRVLDIGCGVGALAEALRTRLGPEGGYVGFDVSAEAIAYCRRRFGSLPAFRFEHADLANGDYAPRGARPAATYRFPLGDGACTLAAAFSVFTHLSANDSAHYLAELGRVLRAGGRAVASFYLLDAQSRAGIADGAIRRRFVVPALGGWTSNPDQPEASMAHDLEVVQGWIDAAGLKVAQMRPGDWRSPRNGLGGQDMLRLEKPL